MRFDVYADCEDYYALIFDVEEDVEWRWIEQSVHINVREIMKQLPN